MLRLHLLLNRPYYEPGGSVVSTVQVYNDPEAAGAAPIRIQELVFLSAGFERTDANWISSLYKPEAATEHTDARKGVRTLFKTDGAMLMRNWELQMGGAHQFTIKFRLPGDLPPTFRGSSIRFNYTVDVKALYELDQGHPAPSTPPPLYETTATTSLLIWPTPTTWGSIMLKRQQPQQQQQQQQLPQPPLAASQPSPFSTHTDTAAVAARSAPEDGNTAEPVASALPSCLSTPAQLPNRDSTQQQQHPTAPPEGDAAPPAQGMPSSAAAAAGAAVAPASVDNDRSASVAAAAVGSSMLKGPLKVLGPCAPQVLPSAASPLRSIAERWEDDSSSDAAQPLLAPSPRGSQQLESASTSRRPSISGNVSLLGGTAAAPAAMARAGAQGSAVVGVARTADDMDVPCLEYALQRSVRAKFREVPVDAALLKGGVAAFGMGTAPLPPTGSSSALSPTLQQAAPTSSASAKGTTTGSSAQLSTLHSMGPNGQQPNGGAAREHGCQHLPQASRLPGERRMAPSPLLTSSQSLSYSAAHVDGAAGDGGEEGWSDSDSEGEEVEGLASPHTSQLPGGALAAKGQQKAEPSIQRPMVSYPGSGPA
eukprot:CAMPEP_0202337826 /NCGR_PEP_ID=MMETSP1126-20121109/356_1 /ASSEMBLY_ACC=CAM_ASM_000457 /TAXON_ID=3047 /ORGANISM="Dunaliella tertiolecta, Strain CCMP1320" /LENGTH=593 /DNA_ID=CAMNT_0048928101 /DNA_START=119 /DNA_END=1898 /DNA_ORIENTATION=+